MSVAFVRNHTAGATETNNTTVLAQVATANVAIGNVLVMWASFDNATTTTPTVSSISVMAGETNLWARVASHDASDPTNGNAVRGEMWAITTTVAWTVGTLVSVTFSASLFAKVVLLSEFSGVTTIVRGTAGTGANTSSLPSATTSGTALAVGDLVLGGGSFEYSGVAPTGDTDTAGGPWSAVSAAQSGGTTTTTGVTALMQYKVLTALGIQTYNPTLTAVTDSGAVVVALVFVNVAPNAPTLTIPANSAIIDRGITQPFGWVISDPNAGDSQSKFDLQYKPTGGSWTTVTQTTPNAFWDAPPATFTAGSYEWQVRTYDALGLVGPWSASSFFTAGTSPGVPSITTPTSGSTVSSSATVTWSVPAQTDYEIRKVADIAGAADTTTIYYDTGDVVDSTTRSVTLTFPTNTRWEHVQVRVKTAGLWSAWADDRVYVSWTPPMAPTIVATTDPTTATIRVAITNPTPTGGAPATSYNDVYVSSPLDTEYRAASLVPPNSTWVWWTPGAGRAYTIRAVAVGTNGTTASQVADTVVIDGGAPTFTTTITLDGGTP